MKKKNILIYGLFLLVLFVIDTNVEAKTYTTYKNGDEITVKLNDNEKSKFYVMEDKDDKVVAVYEDVLGDMIAFGASENGYEGSEVQKSLNSLTASWSNAIEKRLVKVSEIIGENNLSSNYSKEFKTPSYFCNGKNYWLMDTYKEETEEYIVPFDVNYWISYCHIAARADNDEIKTKSYIRPVITVSKDYVIGGSYISEEETLWQKFVETFKKTEIVETIKESEDTTIDITDTSDSLKVVASDGTNTWTTNFTYSDGIVTFVPSDGEDATRVFDGIWVVNCIYTLAKLKDYDIDKLDEWLNEDKTYVLATDGIELETGELKISDKNEFGSFELTADKILSFKLDIKNGLKTFSNELPTENNKNEESKKDEIGKNPNTGSLTTMIIIILGVTLLIGIFAYVYFIRNNESKKIKF